MTPVKYIYHIFNLYLRRVSGGSKDTLVVPELMCC